MSDLGGKRHTFLTLEAVLVGSQSEGDQRADFSFLGPCEEILPQALGEEEEDA